MKLVVNARDADLRRHSIERGLERDVGVMETFKAALKHLLTDLARKK